MPTIESATVSEYIDNERNDNITLENLHFQNIEKGDSTSMIVNDLSILRKYWPELESTSKLVTLNNREKEKYFYKPWLYCYDKYGNSELWFELLKLNQLRSFTQFDHETFRIFDTSIIKKIKTILDMEEETRNINADKILNSKKEAALS